MNKKMRKSIRSKRTAKFRNLSVLLTVLLVVTLVMGVGTAEGTVSRIGGDDRYQTSVLLAEEAFSDGATTVIIARGDQAGNFADGLASSVLSRALDAPVLLTKPNALPADIKTAIRSLGATRAIVLGGTEAISSSVVAGLRDLNLTVSRIEGKDRYETAAKVAREADKKGYIRDYAFIVNGFATADSLVAAPAAFRDKAVILQVAKNSIPKATKEALKDLNINKVYIIGGTAVVNQTVERELEKSYIVKRYGGADRYETSVLVAKRLFPGVDQMVLAGGPDAHLVDSIGACMFGKPILYVKKNEIPRVVEYYLEDTITAYSDPLIVGGTAAISKSVEGAVDKILEKAEDGGSDPGATPVYSTTVKTAAAFRKAIENNNIRTIILGNDITENVTATRSGTANLTINFGPHRLTGSLAITANRIKALNLNGSVTDAITGDLTVEANKATVTNNLSVGGTVYIEDVSSASWIEQVDGNRIILTDDNGATIIIEGQPGSVTVEAGAGENGDINIIVHQPVEITVEDGAEVANITVEEEAGGTSIINDGTIGTVTADGDVGIENNTGDSGQINVSGPGTATVSGKGADQVTGDNVEFVVSAITITTDVVLDGETIEHYDLEALPYGAEVTVTLATATEGAKIYYTEDGTDPEPAESYEYNAPFIVKADNETEEAVEKTITVLATKDEYTDRVGVFSINFKPKYFTLSFDITVVKNGNKIVPATDEGVNPTINVYKHMMINESGLIDSGDNDTYELETDKWYNYTITGVGSYSAVIGQVSGPDDIGDSKTLEITLVKVNYPAQKYYSAGETLEFTISKLLHGQNEVKVGMPIYRGSGGWPWASGEPVLTNMKGVEEVRGEETVEVLWFIGDTSEAGVLTISGKIGEDLPYGSLRIALPDYGYTIDNTMPWLDMRPDAGVVLGGFAYVADDADEPIYLHDPVVVGQTLKALVKPSGATVEYEWQKANAENGTYTKIDGATGESYELVEGDLDSWIRVQVTSKKEGDKPHWGTSYSYPVGPVARGIKVSPLDQTHYAANDLLSFTISGLEPNKKDIRVGLPIFVGDRYGDENEPNDEHHRFVKWASNQPVLTGMKYAEDGLYWVGDTNAQGELEVSGCVGGHLPRGELHFTLPDYGYNIEKARSVGVTVGEDKEELEEALTLIFHEEDKKTVKQNEDFKIEMVLTSNYKTGDLLNTVSLKKDGEDTVTFGAIFNSIKLETVEKKVNGEDKSSPEQEIDDLDKNSFGYELHPYNPRHPDRYTPKLTIITATVKSDAEAGDYTITFTTVDNNDTQSSKIFTLTVQEQGD